jgi:zinc and cadmium transporter
MLSGATALLGGLITFYILDVAKYLVPYILAFSASSFIYIALADLVPQMHKTTNLKKSVIQVLLIILGAGIIFLIKSI